MPNSLTRNELFLQNSLAIAANLLHQVITTPPDDAAGMTCLTIEIQQWFLETKNLLSSMEKARMEMERNIAVERRALSGRVPIVETSGLGWKGPERRTHITDPTTLSHGPAERIPERRMPTSYEAEAYYPTSLGSRSCSELKTKNPFLD